MKDEIEEILEESQEELGVSREKGNDFSEADEDRALDYWLNVKPDKIGNSDLQDEIENLILSNRTSTSEYSNHCYPSNSSPKKAEHRAEDPYTVIKLPEGELEPIQEAVEEGVEHLFALIVEDSLYEPIEPSTSELDYGFGDSRLKDEEVRIGSISRINIGETSSVNIPEIEVDALVDMANRMEGDWYLGHNHPFGNPNPSDTDWETNQMFLNELPGYKGSLIFVEDTNIDAGISAHPLDSFAVAEITDETYSAFSSSSAYKMAKIDNQSNLDKTKNKREERKDRPQYEKKLEF